MAIPLLLKAVGFAGGLYLLGKKKTTAGPSSPSAPGAVPSPVNPMTGQKIPIAERMAMVLASGNSAAIRFEAGRLRQEGYPKEADELDREASKIEKQQAAAAAAASAGGLPPVQTAQPQPPQVIQTPAGPVVMPQVQLPPVQLPSMPLPQVQLPQVPISLPQMPVTLPPIAVPSAQTMPLPTLGAKETLSVLSPGLTYSVKTQQVQAKLISLGLLPAVTSKGGTNADGKYGTTTKASVTNFQLLANAYLKAIGKPVVLPTTGQPISALKVDGIVGVQTLGMLMLAHAPVGSGPTAAYFGGLQMAESPPMPSSPLPGVIPPMAPAPIAPELALASRLTANLSSTPDGREDRNLIQMFQAVRGLKASGYYNPETAWALVSFGFVPPRPRSWPRSGTGKAKRNFKRALLDQAAREPQRAEEWTQAASQIV